MAQYSQFSFDVPTTNADGTPLNLAETFNVLVDTVNPPVKSYAVPSTVTPSGTPAVLTVTFAQLGFTPSPNVPYFAAAEAVDAAGTSALSNVVTFTETVPPAAPTSFKVG